MKSTFFSEEFVKNLINSTENKTLDFKLKVTSTSKIARSLAAMANTEGGILIIGINDQKKVIGIDLNEERFMIDQANEKYCTPKVSISMHDFQWKDEESKKTNAEKWILLVEVKKSEGPTIYCEDKSGIKRKYIRIEDQNRLVS